MDQGKRLAQDIAAFREECNTTVVECQKFCYITRAKEFQEQAHDRLMPLKAKATGLKERAIAGKYEDAANAMLSYEAMTEALINELCMWIALKDDEPSAAWEFLINAQKAAITAMEAHSVADHLEGYNAHLTALEKHIFPNHGFYSIGAIVKKSECSICGQEYGECDHLLGRPYMGKICAQHVTEYELEECSIVFSPANKYCRFTAITDEEGVKRDTLTWRVIPNSPTPHDEESKQTITNSSAPEVPFLPIFCPTWNRQLFRVVQDGMEIKCKSCKQVHLITHESLKQQWSGLAQALPDAALFSIRCPTWNHQLIRVVQDGIEIKCKSCKQAHLITRESLKQQWAELARIQPGATLSQTDKALMLRSLNVVTKLIGL